MEYCNGSPTLLKRFWYKLSTNIRTGHWAQWDKMPRLSLFEAERQLLRGEFDVFHPTFYNDYFLSYIGNKPFVLTVHDMIPELYPQYFPRDYDQIVLKKKLIPLANAIVAVSENTKKDIIRIYGVPASKIHVVYHGSSLLSENSDNNYDFPYLLYVGGRWYYKNFPSFVKSIVPVLLQHNDTHVICTGESFNKEEQDLMRQYGVEDRFISCLVKTDRDLYSLYHHALGFVYPSEYEGFGIPILEAYQADCPVLLNNASCFPEIAGDAAIYFNMDSKNSNLTEQIECLLSMSAEERRTLLTRQRERLKRFSWEKSAKQLADVYQSVINEKNCVH
jgi:glycosyltransferase involved in cell wall biosynthesis